MRARRSPDGIPEGAASSSGHDRDGVRGAVGAQFVAGKAARDALFLANLDVTALPTMVVATAAFSILLVALSSRGLRRVPPGTLDPARVRGQRRAASSLTGH